MLTLCLLYPRRDVALLSAFAAIGVGIGGQMTYGQTVGFIVKPETFLWGLLGLTLKGAIWGLLAGAIIGMAYNAERRLVLPGALLVAAATWFGWKFVNNPKLIYFSHPTDRPREEVWAGFLLAAIALLGWLAWKGYAQPALRFALAGLVGGGIGFGGGGTIHAICNIYFRELQLHSWKYMEFFFGFCFGLALGWAAKNTLPPEQRFDERPLNTWLEMAGAALVTGLTFWLSWNTPTRFSYLLVGCALFFVLTRWQWPAWHIAMTVTFTGFALDSARYWSNEYKHGAPEPAYAMAIAASIAFAWFLIRNGKDTFRALQLLTWTAVADAAFKFGMNPAGIGMLLDPINIAFIGMAIAVTYMSRRVAAPVALASPQEVLR